MINIELEKKVLKKEIDRLEDEDVLQAIKILLNSAHESQEIWDDKKFEKELRHRSAAFKLNNSKRYTWEEAKAAARKEHKARSKKAK